jgi:hypothetical protein
LSNKRTSQEIRRLSPSLVRSLNNQGRIFASYLSTHSAARIQRRALSCPRCAGGGERDEEDKCEGDEHGESIIVGWWDVMFVRVEFVASWAGECTTLDHLSSSSLSPPPAHATTPTNPLPPETSPAPPLIRPIAATPMRSACPMATALESEPSHMFRWQWIGRGGSMCGRRRER